MPPSACSNGRRAGGTAPVKAPFSWPKSSLSMSPSGMAPRLTATKGAWNRGLNSWTIRASPSLPVPVSPRMSTVVAAGATSRTRSTTWRIGCALRHVAVVALDLADLVLEERVLPVEQPVEPLHLPSIRLLWSAMATRRATCRATSKQQASSPSAGGWAMSRVPSGFPLEDEGEGDEGAVAERGEEPPPRGSGGRRARADRPRRGRGRRGRARPRTRPGRTRCRARGGVPGIGDEHDLGPGRVVRGDPVDGDARLPEVALEQLAGPGQDGGEVHRREDELDRLLDDSPVDVVLRRPEYPKAATHVAWLTKSGCRAQPDLGDRMATLMEITAVNSTV